MSEKIYLKPLTKEHLNDYLHLVNDPEVQRTTSPYQTFKEFTAEELTAWLEKIPGRVDRKDFAIFRVADGAFLGEVVLNEFDNGKSNIRLALMSKYFGKGYGYEAMKLAIQFGWEELHLKEITLSVFDFNERGLRLYRKLGFEVTGRGHYEGFAETYMSLKSP